MNESPTMADRIGLALERLSERERVLLGLMVVVLSTLVALATGYVVTTRMADLDEEIIAKREALGMLTTQRESYLRNSEANERLREQLRDNELRLSTFIEGRAGRASIPRPREFRDNQQVLDGGVTMFTTTAEFASMDLDQLQRLMQSIEESEELVFSRQLAVTPARRGATGYELELTLATYRQSGGSAP